MTLSVPRRPLYVIDHERFTGPFPGSSFRPSFPGAQRISNLLGPMPGSGHRRAPSAKDGAMRFPLGKTRREYRIVR